MPYEGEYAGYRPLQRIAESPRVQSLLRRARSQPGAAVDVSPVSVPAAPEYLPEFVLAIDGSTSEVDVVNGYPGAKVGYCTVASVLLNLRMVDALDESRPIDPVEFRKTETAGTLDEALPGSNVVTRDHISARDSFREALYEVLHDRAVDDEDPAKLIQTYEELLALKPKTRYPACPYDYDGCEEAFEIGRGLTSCRCPKRRAIYSTDALRIHERFKEYGSNGEALGEVMQVWERLLLLHILRSFERQDMLSALSRVAFVLDGPLALFGHPAWLSAPISRELKRLNSKVLAECDGNLLIFGVEKSGSFVDHFDQIDQTEEPGEARFPPRSCYLPTDEYIKSRIIYSNSEKRYGLDTYFGRKVFYKTRGGSRIIVTIPFLDDAQDSLAHSDLALYPQLVPTCALLDKLVSSRFSGAISPIVSAHAYAAIPLELGSKVLQQLARELMREPR